MMTAKAALKESRGAILKKANEILRKRRKKRRRPIKRQPHGQQWFR
jgi:translation elongation factor EF-Ts